MTDWLDELRSTAAEVKAEPPPRPAKAQANRESPVGPRNLDLRSDEYIAYLNAMTSVRVLFNDGSEVVTLLTPTGLDEVLAARRPVRKLRGTA